MERLASPFLMARDLRKDFVIGDWKMFYTSYKVHAFLFSNER